MIKLNAVESTCAVHFYTVVDTFQAPVHNSPCQLHWERDTGDFGFYNFSFFLPLIVIYTR